MEERVTEIVIEGRVVEEMTEVDVTATRDGAPVPELARTVMLDADEGYTSAAIVVCHARGRVVVEIGTDTGDDWAARVVAGAEHATVTIEPSGRTTLTVRTVIDVDWFSAWPAPRKEVDDKGAEELAEIDNLQREDLTPIEQGEAYHRLCDHLDVAEVARRVGRTVEHVRQRMRLAMLHDPIRAMVAAEQLDIGAAELIAQTPDAVQKKLAPALLRQLTPNRWDPRTGRETKVELKRVSRQDVQELLEEYTHDLATAPFDITDAALVREAGACGTCAKRTGVQGVLVEVLDATDTCLDAACWGGKLKANRERVTEDARKRGLKVLTDKEAERVFSHDDRTRYDAKFKAVTEKVSPPGSTSDVPVAKLIDDTTPRVLAFTDTGRPVELVPRDVVDAALKARAKAETKAGPGASAKKVEDAHAREKRKEKDRAELLKRSAHVALRQVRELVEGGRVSIETVLRVVIAEAGITQAEIVGKARHLEKAATGYVDTLTAAAATIVDTQKSADARARHLAALVAELVVGPTIHTGSYSMGNQATPPALKAFDVDLAACRRAAEGELRAEAMEKAAKKATKDVPDAKAKASKAKPKPKPAKPAAKRKGKR
jgi:ParB-like chromosome segregation protein Spo0J